MSGFDDIYFRLVDELGLGGTKKDIPVYLNAIAERYDFKSVAYFLSNLPNSKTDEPYLAVTYSREWIDHYKSEKYENIDPVLSAGFSSLLPIDWRKLPTSNRHKKLFGEALEHGLGCQGLTIPIRGRLGERALFSVTCDATDTEWNTKCRWLMRDFQSIAHHFHHMILRAEDIKISEINLAPREIECLRWAAQGKTASEIGIILSISERTVEYYLNDTKVKLNATNITQAVAKAMSHSIYYRSRKTQ